MPRNKFLPKNTYGKNNKGKTYISKGSSHPDNCAHCIAVSTGKKFDTKKWRREYWQTARLKKFGLTQEQYDTLYEKQGGVCAICDNPRGSKWGTLSIDHDHKTGQVRGLLCITCNTLLGRLEKRFERTMKYLGIKSLDSI